MKRLLLAATLTLVGLLGLPGTGVAAAPAPASSPSTVNDPSGKVGIAAVHECHFGQGNCAFTLVNLNVRCRPDTTSCILDTNPKGSEVILFCWQRGQSINGDDVWYYGRFNSDYPHYPEGFMAGWYLSTGADPSPVIPHC